MVFWSVNRGCVARGCPWVLLIAVLALCGMAHAENYVLPPLQEADYKTDGSWSKRDATFVKNYRLSGNTVVDSSTIHSVVLPYLNRYVSFEDLSQLRDALTLIYVQRGYISSGAEMPRINKNDDTLEISIVEGVLDGMRIDNPGRLRESYIRKRLSVVDESIVNIYDIEQELQKLQQNKRIKGIQSQLLPSDKVGESLLAIKVDEQPPLFGSLRFSNHNTPSSGSELAELMVGHSNVSGYGDTVTIALAKSEGRRSVDTSYELPTSVATSVYLQLQSSRSDIIEEPFDVLEIESESDSISLGINYLVSQSIYKQLELFAGMSYRRSKSFLLGSPFSFSAGVEDGVAKIGALQIGQEWQGSAQGQALALRSTFSIGLDVLGATSNEGNNPDGQFTKWLGQAQYVLQISEVDAQFSVLTDIQWASRPLLGLEKYAIGGHASVRGYRENSLLVDKGLFLSAKWRQELKTEGLSGVYFIPFFDVAYGKEDEYEQSLSSVGVGFKWVIEGIGDMDLYWAKRLDNWVDGDEIQDQGIHLSVGLSF